MTDEQTEPHVSNTNVLFADYLWLSDLCRDPVVHAGRLLLLPLSKAFASVRLGHCTTFLSNRWSAAVEAMVSVAKYETQPLHECIQ